MKKFLKISGVTIALISLGAFIFYLIVIRPIATEEEALKPVMIAAANDLLKCSFESKEIEACYNQKTSKSFQGAMSLAQYVAMITKVKEKLGNRMSAELMDGKFNLMVYKGVPSGKKVDFIINAAYQNDIFAHETYIYSLDQTTNEYKLDSIRFASDKLIN